MNHAEARHITELPPDAVLRTHLRPLRPMLDDPDITEICINRPGEAFSEGSRGWARHDLPQLTELRCLALTKAIAAFNGRGINPYKPILSGELPDGERAYCVIPPCCEPRTVSITIRKHASRSFSIDDMAQSGLFERLGKNAKAKIADDTELRKLHKSQQWIAFLQASVRARKNIVVSGATGSGKTTLLRVMLIPAIPQEHRLIAIEDVPELDLTHPNRVNLRYENDGAKQAQGNVITAKDLLRGCLRMRPDRILVSEIRGQEAYDFLVNINSGHPGTLTTVHGGSADEALETLMLRVGETPEGRNLSREQTMTLLRKSIDIIVQMHHRKITEIRLLKE